VTTTMPAVVPAKMTSAEMTTTPVKASTRLQRYPASLELLTILGEQPDDHLRSQCESGREECSLKRLSLAGRRCAAFRLGPSGHLLSYHTGRRYDSIEPQLHEGPRTGGRVCD